MKADPSVAPDPVIDGKPIIAMIADVFDQYQRTITHRLASRARAAGYRLLVVAGGGLGASGSNGHDPESVSGGSAIHFLSARLEVDGYIVQPGAVGHDVDLPVIRAFVRRFAHRPLACIGMPLTGIASVAGDDADTTHALMRHMTSDPARRRFVFLRGNRGSHEACERERVFRQVMAERGLPVDESLVLDTHFNPSEAYTRVNELLLRGVRFDALIAANDVVASNAARALDRHGLRVPKDVIVSGFDDHEEGRLCSPPLTTVRLPIEPQVDIAFDALLAQMSAAGSASVPVARHVIVPCTLCLRGSSGAGAPAVETFAPVPADPEPLTLGAVLARGLASTTPPGTIDVVGVSGLLVRALEGGAEHLQDELIAAMRPGPGAPVAVCWWREVRATLDHIARAGLHGMPITGFVASLARVQGTISDTIWAEVRRQQAERMVTCELLEYTHLALGRCISAAALREVLHEAIPQLSLGAFYLARYTGEPEERPGEHASIELALVHGTPVPIAEPEFASPSIAPPELLHRPEIDALVMCPLHAGGLHYGFLLHDIHTPVALSMQALAQSIANAMQSCRHVESLERHARELQVANADLARLATRDSLTGLINRAGFLVALERCLDDTVRNGTGGALLYLDLDGFKAVNDTYGHATGDRLLRTIGLRISGLLRSEDPVARLGGDEFTIALGDACERIDIQRIVRALVSEIARPVPIGEAIVSVSASIGIARFPLDGTRADDLLRRADAAMYRAKRAGRNRHVWFSHSIEQRERDRQTLDRALRTAQEDGDLWLAWQPRVSLADGRTVAFEALLRWNSQRRAGRDVGPDEFVPLAERSGMVRQLDAFALDQACLQQARWEAQGYRIDVSVNLSAASLQDEGTVTRIVRTLEHHGVRAERIELELTESAAMSDVATGIPRLQALRELGLKLAIDDFGTAYSSLDYLKRLPATSLKIDRSFIRDIRSRHDTDSADAAIVRAIVRLGQELGFRIVAEGIETLQQRDFLAALHCDEGQGFLFDRPLDAARAMQRLSDDGRSNSEDPDPVAPAQPASA